MSWPSAVEVGIFGTGAFLGGGGITACVEWLRHKPKERALTEAVKSETDIDRLKLWMNGLIITNKTLVATNTRIEKDKKRLEGKTNWQQRELNAHRSLALIIEWLMPKLQPVLDVGEMAKLSDALDRVKEFNHNNE